MKSGAANSKGHKNTYFNFQKGYEKRRWLCVKQVATGNRAKLLEDLLESVQSK